MKLDFDNLINLIDTNSPKNKGSIKTKYENKTPDLYRNKTPEQIKIKSPIKKTSPKHMKRISPDFKIIT